MRYNLLGQTGLYVSELCLGTMTFGGTGFWKTIGTLGTAEAEQLVGTALDAGVNFIDTADVYSEGDSERLVGAALKSLARPREQVVVATKVRGRVGPGVNEVGLSRAHILASIDRSLARLGLDHVDLYQIHGFDPVTPIEEIVRALDDVVRSGKVRYVGFSNLPAWVASKALTLAAAHGLARFQSAQVYYSIAGRDIEREIAPMCAAERVAILPWSPLAGCLLSGRFDPDKKGRVRLRGLGSARRPLQIQLARSLLGIGSQADMSNGFAGILNLEAVNEGIHSALTVKPDAHPRSEVLPSQHKIARPARRSGVRADRCAAPASASGGGPPSG